MANEMFGAVSKIAIAKEATFGGSAGTARSLGVIPGGVQLPDKTVDNKQYRALGAGRRFNSSKPGRYEFQGSIPFLPVDGTSMYYAFGADDCIADSATPTRYIHRLYPGNHATLPSFTMTAEMGGGLTSPFGGTAVDSNVPRFRRTFKGVSVNSMSFSLAETGELSASMDVFAKDIENDETDPGADLVPQLPAKDPYMFYDRQAAISVGGTYDAAGLKAGTGYIDTTKEATPYSNTTTSQTIDGVARTDIGRTLARVRNFNFSISNNLKPMYVLGSGGVASQKPYAFIPSYPSFSLNLEVTPSDFKYSTRASQDVVYDLLNNDIRGDIRIPFQRGSGNSDRIEFVFFGCRFQAAPHSIPDDGAELNVPIAAVPENFAVMVWDTTGDYDGSL